MTNEEFKAERRQLAQFLAQPAGDVLLRYLRRRWRDATTPGETGDQMIHRLGRLDVLADLERLREEAKGA